MNLTRLCRSIIVGFALLVFLITSLQPQRIAQAAGVVGTGTPGSCTEAALETALTGGGLITFNCGAMPHTIILTSYKVITVDTEIRGGGLITLSGGNTTPLFSIFANMTIRDIALTRGFGSFGTLRNFESLTLIGSQITYGYSTSSGGAIENHGEITIDDSTLAHNSASDAGGAIMNDSGEATIENSLIYSNTGQNHSGAIYNDTGTMQIHNSQVYDNQSAACANSSQGGGIQNTGTLTVTHSIVANNKAAHGGGIHNSGYTFLDNATIEGNQTYLACYGHGGGMMNESQAAIQNSEFTDNSSAAYGGGLMTSAGSQTVILDSTFTQNYALGGGAISNSGTLSLINSTVYTNTSGYGGGIANGIAGGGTPDIIILTNVTVSNNSSTGGAGGLQTNDGVATVTFGTFMDNQGDSGIEQNGGTLNLKNSVIASSSPKNCEGSITSQGFNISSDYSCAFSQGGDKNNTDPLLGLLANNGGLTLTHLPQENSPAVDGGQCVTGITADQRGVLRPQGAACDIGAVEFQELRLIFLPLLNR